MYLLYVRGTYIHTAEVSNSLHSALSLSWDGHRSLYFTETTWKNWSFYSKNPRFITDHVRALLQKYFDWNTVVWRNTAAPRLIENSHAAV